MKQMKEKLSQILDSALGQIEASKELDKLNATLEEWKLRAMGTTIGCHTIVKKGTEGNDIKTYDLT